MGVVIDKKGQKSDMVEKSMERRGKKMHGTF